MSDMTGRVAVWLVVLLAALVIALVVPPLLVRPPTPMPDDGPELGPATCLVQTAAGSRPCDSCEYRGPETGWRWQPCTKEGW